MCIGLQAECVRIHCPLAQRDWGTQLQVQARGKDKNTPKRCPLVGKVGPPKRLSEWDNLDKSYQSQPCQWERKCHNKEGVSVEQTVLAPSKNQKCQGLGVHSIGTVSGASPGCTARFLGLID